jgi:hypothetical protein
MTLQTVGPPDRGSLSVVYACPECGYEIAMLTNAYETQMVQSLGVRIGPERQTTTAAEGIRAPENAPEASDRTSGSRCPFSAMIPATDEEHATAAGDARPGSGQTPEPVAVRWTAAAEARLQNVPAFVRPMARTGIERFARERGASEVDDAILDAAREFFGM